MLLWQSSWLGCFLCRFLGRFRLGSSRWRLKVKTDLAVLS